MQSQAKNVDAYLNEVPTERMAALKQLREMCLSTLDGYAESMRYGMPSYAKDGTVEVAFASQKNYISFYILKEEVFNRYRPALKGLDLGKGCIRYSKPEKIDFDIVEKLLVDMLNSNADIC
ncbi:MAG: iron chaperone [Anaerolineae bacterium]